MIASEILRATTVVVASATIGLIAFVVTALVGGEPVLPAWDAHGLGGVILWSYERASLVTVSLLFVLALACAVMPLRYSFLAAVSLGLFYPTYAVIRILAGTYSQNLPPLEFLGYLLFIVVCALGYALGRWLVSHGRRRDSQH
jgi:hypothetical protein